MQRGHRGAPPPESGSFRRAARVGALALAAVTLAACTSRAPQPSLPPALPDEELWRLSTSLSEPAGAFEFSTNLVSNEVRFANTVHALAPSGGAYVGVGPEQNFSFIAKLRPSIAFIVDIRADNRSLHLMYKALFELSRDRGEFVSRLFARTRPDGIAAGTSVQELFARLEAAPVAADLYEANARAVRDLLVERHRWTQAESDVTTIRRILYEFMRRGPGIHYDRPDPQTSRDPTYAQLMIGLDMWGQPGSYLSSEEAFAFVKDLQARNLIVPVVGDFAGPNAVRGVGDYVRQHGAVVSAFYASNVEVYLTSRQTAAYCGNLKSLPHGQHSAYIDSRGARALSARLERCGPAPR